MFRVEFTPEAREAIAFLKREIPERLRALEQHVVNQVADAVLNEVRRKIPDKPELLAKYREALDLYAVETPRGRMTAVAGEVAASLQTVDAERTIVLFPPPKAGRQDPVAAILHQYEPWAVTSVPLVTVKGDVVFRIVSKTEVQSTAKKNAVALPTVQAMLKAAKIPLGKSFVAEGRAQIDLEHMALQVEFGGPGYKKVAAWAPAISRAERGHFLKTSGIKKLAERLLSDPNFQGWKAQTAPPDKTLLPATLKQFEGFQKAVRG